MNKFKTQNCYLRIVFEKKLQYTILGTFYYEWWLNYKKNASKVSWGNNTNGGISTIYTRWSNALQLQVF